MKWSLINKFILTSVLLIKLIKTIDSSAEVKGFCGDPIKPVKSQLSPIQFTYNEDETIVYKCDDYISIKQYQKCIKGKWTGITPICGNSFRNNDLKFARILNGLNNQLIHEYNTTNLEKFEKFGNSFIAERYAQPLRAFGSKSYKFELHMSYKAMFQLVRISFSVVNHLIDDKIKDAKFNITRVAVSPYRECYLNSHSSVSPWFHNSTRYDFWFSCQSLNELQFEKELKDKSDLVIIETKCDKAVSLDMATFILAEQYTNDGNPREPICGLPQIPIGLESNVIHHQTKYSFKCAQGFQKLDRFGGDTHELVCGTDMKWKGSLPVCFPQNMCNKFESSETQLTEVYLYEKVYYYNTSLWFAIEGTKAYFRCKNAIQIFIGKEVRVCGKDGQWSDNSPNCLTTNLNVQSESKLNLTSVTITLIVLLTLIITISLTAIIICCYLKMKKSRPKQSNSTNIYADYDSTECEPKQLDAELYERIDDDRYTDYRYFKTSADTSVSHMYRNMNDKNDYDDCAHYTNVVTNVDTNNEDSYVVMKVH